MPEENISAIATPPGKGGVAIIRLSGGQSAFHRGKNVRPCGTVAVKDFEPYRLYPAGRRRHVYRLRPVRLF